MPEIKDVPVNEQVIELFEHLGEKPRMETNRIGKEDKGTKSAVRPVKVSFPCSSIVQCILGKARKLSQSGKFKPRSHFGRAK